MMGDEALSAMQQIRHVEASRDIPTTRAVPWYTDLRRDGHTSAIVPRRSRQTPLLNILGLVTGAQPFEHINRCASRKTTS